MYKTSLFFALSLAVANAIVSIPLKHQPKTVEQRAAMSIRRQARFAGIARGDLSSTPEGPSEPPLCLAVAVVNDP